ncbi:MAG: hypothetical protein G01um1014106_183 [Parcubacteria group bacterium Gr01-1014_106]|nr:MAG: hypothetical protein G01um1014106_183 [Parcubacteria group bacterium Gr01-1014_106]
MSVGVFFITPRLHLVDASNSPGKDTTIPVWSGLTAHQTFRSTRTSLVALRVDTDPTALPDTRIEFRIRRAHGTDDLQFFQGPVHQFQSPDKQALIFTFPPLNTVRNETLLFSLSAPEAAKAYALPVRFEIAGGLYAAGERFENGRVRPGDLGFTAWVRAGRIESWKLRLREGTSGLWVAGAIVLIVIGLLLIDFLPAWRHLPSRTTPWTRIALLASVAIAVLYTLPVYARLGYWGTDEGDWPELVSHLSAARQTLAFGEFPGWNPYMCGGTPGFANPQTYFLSPTLLASMIAGEVVGPKLVVPLVLASGLFGFFLLARALHLRGIAALLPGMVFLLSGFTTTHLANGQFLWLTLAWVPWVMVGYLRSLDGSRWWTLLAAGSLTLIFVEGRVYLVAYVVLALCMLAVFLSLQQRRTRPLQQLVLVGALFIALGAWKLLPTLTFLADRELALSNTDGIPLSGLDEAFLRRDVTPSGTDVFGTVHLPRHEYAAYIGILPLFLAALSMLRNTRRRALPLLGMGGVFLFLATQSASASVLEYMPILRELRNPSRMLSMVVFSIALLSGLGLQTLLRHVEARRSSWLWYTVALGCFVIILADLVLIGWSNFAHLFPRAPQPHTFIDTGFFQTKAPDVQAANGYPAVAAGKGARDFCPAVLRAYRPVHAVRVREDSNYRGEVYAENGASVRLLQQTPNSVRVAVDTDAPDTIVVNQQFDRGWSARPFPVENHGTLLAAPVPVGRHVVVFRYRPPGIMLGSLVSVATVVGLAAVWMRTRFAHGSHTRRSSETS